MFLAQYEVLRERGHSPSEAFNETVEEATQSLYPLIGANGMDWMYEACSTTARRGALDWTPRFKSALKPVFNQLYDAVKDGSETQRSLDYNGTKDYRAKFEAEMEEIRGLEIWRAGKAVRYVSTESCFCIVKQANRCMQWPPTREPEVSDNGLALTYGDDGTCVNFCTVIVSGSRWGIWACPKVDISARSHLKIPRFLVCSCFVSDLSVT